MATNRTTTRRRSARQAFDDDDAPAPKRVKADVKKTNGATTAAAKKAAKVAYDENDDGFQFSRRTSRRTTKAQAVPAQEPIPEHEEAKPAPKAAPRRKKSMLPVPEPEAADTGRRRRSARISGDRENLEMRPKSTEPVVPKRTRKSMAPEKEKKKKAVSPAPEAKPEQTRAFARVQTPPQDDKKRDANTQRIMLPFADTPVITRNKEMRKGNKDGHRRSSTGLRGRRASSLIDSGMSNALPHSEVEVRDYYKYIEQSLPEPRRMKQLITWCGSRALPEKPSGDVKNANAIMAARAIQQELIDDFANKPELSYWFDREDTEPTPVTRKPNPQNEKNKSTLEELEAEIKRLEEEKAAWESLVSSTKSMTSPVPSIPAPTFSLADIDASLLDPTQAPILAALQQSTPQGQPQSESSTAQPPSSAFTFTTATALQAHLNKLSLSLEPNIDLFTDGVHKIEQYRNTADRVADRVLGTAAKRLDERDREVKERAGADGIGVGDILRGLAGVLGESG